MQVDVVGNLEENKYRANRSGRGLGEGGGSLPAGTFGHERMSPNGQKEPFLSLLEKFQFLKDRLNKTSC